MQRSFYRLFKVLLASLCLFSAYAWSQELGSNIYQAYQQQQIMQATLLSKRARNDATLSPENKFELLGRSGLLHLQFNNRNEGIAILEEALALVDPQKLNSVDFYVGVLSNFIGELIKKGNYGEAAEKFSTLEALIQKHGKSEDMQGVQAKLIKAELLYSQGNYFGYTDIIDEAHRIIVNQQHNPKFGFDQMHTQLRITSMKMGQLEQSLAYGNEFQRLTTNPLDKSPQGKAMANFAKVKLLDLLGRTHQARSIMEETYAKQDLPLEIKLSALQLLAGYAYTEGNYALSIEYFEKVAAYFENRPFPTNPAISSYIYIANAYLNINDQKQALHYAKKALSEFEQNPGINMESHANTFSSLSDIFFETGDFASADKFNLRAKDLLRGSRSLYTAMFWRELLDMRIAFAINNVEALITAEDRLYRFLEDPYFLSLFQLNNNQEESKKVRDLYSSYALLIQHNPKKYEPRAFRALQRINNSNLSKRYESALKRSTVDAELSVLLHKKEYLEKVALLSVTDPKQQEILGNSLVEINQKLGEQLAGNSNSSFTMDDFESIQSKLRGNEALIQFFEGGANYYAWVISHDRKQLVSLNVNSSEISTEIHRLRASIIPDASGVLPDFDFSLASRLYNKLFQPFESQLASKTLLYVVPDKILFSLPLAALRTTEKNNEVWLMEKFATVVLPSAKILKSNPHKADNLFKKAFLGVGDPVLGDPKEPNMSELALRSNLLSETFFDGKHLKELSSLPDTSTELNGIAKNWDATTTTLLTRNNATESRVKALNLSEYKYIAFATHALLASDSSDRSEPGLVLTPPAAPSAADDGVMTTSEIMSLPINAEWVVLSACNTGGLNDTIHQNFMDLANGFFFSGAKSLLVTAWDIESSSAALLTSLAFEAFSNSNETGKAEALASSMLRLASGEFGEQYTHPFYWAPFFNIGN